jgi:hypothetical protein
MDQNQLCHRALAEESHREQGASSAIASPTRDDPSKGSPPVSLLST